MHDLDRQNARSSLVIAEQTETFGADPLSVGVDTLNRAGHEKTPLLQVIRAKCRDCSAGSDFEIRKCVASACALWPYRMGRNPFATHPGNAEALRRARAR